VGDDLDLEVVRLRGVETGRFVRIFEGGIGRDGEVGGGRVGPGLGVDMGARALAHGKGGTAIVGSGGRGVELVRVFDRLLVREDGRLC
jgi:hypothetical protein